MNLARLQTVSALAAVSASLIEPKILTQNQFQSLKEDKFFGDSLAARKGPPIALLVSTAKFSPQETGPGDQTNGSFEMTLAVWPTLSNRSIGSDLGLRLMDLDNVHWM